MELEDLKLNWETISKELDQNRDDANLEVLIKKATETAIDGAKSYMMKGFLYGSIVMILLILTLIFADDTSISTKYFGLYVLLPVFFLGCFLDGYSMYLFSKINVNQQVKELEKQLDKLWSYAMLELKLMLVVVVCALVATFMIYDEFPWGHAIAGFIGGAIGLGFSWRHIKRMKKCRSEIKQYNNEFSRESSQIVDPLTKE